MENLKIKKRKRKSKKKKTKIINKGKVKLINDKK